jgi:hypothetical protein
MNATTVEKLFNSIVNREDKSANIFARFGDFKNLSNDICFQVTGYTKDEFILILSEIKSLNKSPQRTKEQALAVYLFWLKNGLEQSTIASYFQTKTRFSIQNYCDQVREALLKDFVPKYLSSKSKTRQDWLMDNSYYVKNLFDLNDDQLAIVCDGTYIYCEKSANHSFQRSSYN